MTEELVGEVERPKLKVPVGKIEPLDKESIDLVGAAGVGAAGVGCVMNIDGRLEGATVGVVSLGTAASVPVVVVPNSKTKEAWRGIPPEETKAPREVE